MHTRSKKNFQSFELDTLRRSRNTIAELTVNGEVYTDGDSQVYVHDLNLFVTAQSLEETLAVPSFPRLDRGFSVRGSVVKRLTKEVKTIACKMDNFVPLVVPGLSPELGAIHCQRRHWRIYLSSTSSAQERSDGPRTTRVLRIIFKKTRNKNTKRMTVEIWSSVCKIFLHRQVRGLMIACTRNQFSELRFGTFYESGIKIKEAQYVYIHQRKCSLQKTHWRSSTSKVLNEECESRNNHRYAIVVQDVVTQWIQSLPCKTQILRRRKRVDECSSSRPKTKS